MTKEQITAKFLRNLEFELRVWGITPNEINVWELYYGKCVDDFVSLREIEEKAKELIAAFKEKNRMLKLQESRINYYTELINKNKECIRVDRSREGCYWIIDIMDVEGLNIKNNLYSGLTATEALHLLKGIYFGMLKQ